MNCNKIQDRMNTILKSKDYVRNMDIIPNKIIYKNGIKVGICSMNINIKGFKDLYHNMDITNLAKIMKSLITEIKSIVGQTKYLKLNIINENIMVIYKVSQLSDLNTIFNTAININTFIKIFNDMIKKYYDIVIKIGIGISYDKELVLSLKNDEQIDNIILGDVINDSLNLSFKANKDLSPIVLDNRFYTGLIKNEGLKRSWFTKNEDLIHCNIVYDLR